MVIWYILRSIVKGDLTFSPEVIQVEWIEEVGLNVFDTFSASVWGQSSGRQPSFYECILCAIVVPLLNCSVKYWIIFENKCDWKKILSHGESNSRSWHQQPKLDYCVLIYSLSVTLMHLVITQVDTFFFWGGGGEKRRFF